MRVVRTTFKARDRATLIEVLSEIPGGPDLLAWFGGRLPSFHDGEILSLELDRKDATCRIRVHTWEMTREVDEAGYYKNVKDVMVSFELSGVTELSLEGFNHQNVVFGLYVERSDDRFQMELEPCYGLSGTITAKAVRVTLEPGAPPGSRTTTRSSARPLIDDDLKRLRSPRGAGLPPLPQWIAVNGRQHSTSTPRTRCTATL